MTELKPTVAKRIRFTRWWPHVRLTRHLNLEYERLVCSDGQMVGYADVPIIEDKRMHDHVVHFDRARSILEGWRQAKEMLAIEPAVKPTGNANVDDPPVAWTGWAGA